MTTAINIAQGPFGRVALLDMDKPLVRHAHPQLHILQKISGADQIFVVDGEQCLLSDDTAVLVNTWSEHYYPHEEYVGNTTCLAIYLEPDWLAGIDDGLKWSRHPGFFENSCVPITPEIKEQARAIAEELGVRSLSDASSIESLVFDLAFAYVDRFSAWRELRAAQAYLPGVNDYRIRRVLKHLRDSKGQSTETIDLASIAGISRPRFFELFKQQTGLTPAVFANTLRVESTLKQLCQTDETIAEISFTHGFEEQTNFTRFFRQHVGIPPVAYRKTVTEPDSD